MAEQAQQVADELEIRNLINRLADLADSGDLDEYTALFTEDAVWEMLPKPGSAAMFPAKRGHRDIRQGAVERRATGATGPGSHTKHVPTGTVVRVSRDTATSTTTLLFYKNTDAAPALALITLYADEFRRTREGWKLARRTISHA
jgi:3-phenylpropionate/cinnamic acid dioxygenase small subunit